MLGRYIHASLVEFKVSLLYRRAGMTIPTPCLSVEDEIIERRDRSCFLAVKLLAGSKNTSLWFDTSMVVVQKV